MRHQIALLARSRVFRGLVAAAAVVGLAAGAFKAVSDAYTLSPQQEAMRYLGEADAKVEVYAPAPAGEYPALPEQFAGFSDLAAIAEYSSMVDLVQAGNAVRFSYVEVPFPSVGTQSRLELVSGTYPAQVGHCVAQTPVEGTWQSTHEPWQLEVVGHYRDLYASSGDVLLCAPGTWGARRPHADSFETLDAAYFVQAPKDSLVALQSLAAEQENGEAFAVLLREQLLAGKGVSAQRFLGGYSLAFVLLFGIPFVFAGRLARWVTEIQLVLIRSGVAPALIARAALTATIVAVGLIALSGSLVGMLGVLACYPVLHQLGGGLPLGPWRLDLWPLLVAVVAVVGAVGGFLLLNASQRVRARLSQRAARPLTPLAGLVLNWVSLSFLGLAAWSLLTSSGRLWPMALGAVFAVIGVAAFAPRLALWLARARQTASPRDLAARLLREDGARWAGICGMSTLIVGLLFTVMINVSASVSAQLQLATSPVPQGMALLETVAPDGTALSDEVRAAFESENALGPGIRLRGTLFGDGESGLVQVFDSADDAQKVLGLTPEQKQFLAQGGVLRIGGADERVRLLNFGDPGQEISVEVKGFKPEAQYRLNTGYGFALADALLTGSSAQEGTGSWLVYLGLSPEQTQAIRSWPVESGNGGINLSTYSAPEGLDLPLWLAVGFLVLAAVSIPLLVWSLQREIRALRPFAKNLIAMGLPIAWARQVLVAVIAPVLLVPLLLGLGAGFGTTVVLHWLYPPVFDLAGISYPGIALVVGALLLAGGAVVLLGSNRLHRAPSSSVV